MDQAQARALLAGERARLQRLLQAAAGEPPAAELGDWGCFLLWLVVKGFKPSPITIGMAEPNVAA